MSIGYERGDFVEGNVIYLPLHVPLAKALFHRLPVIPAADEGVAYFFFRKGRKEIAENGGRVDKAFFNVKLELYFPSGKAAGALDVELGIFAVDIIPV